MSIEEFRKKRAEYQRLWVQRNREKVSAWRRARVFGAKRETILEQKRRSYRKNKEHVLEYQRKYRALNKEKIAERERRRRENANPEITRLKKAEEYRKHRDRYARNFKLWKKKNPNWDREWRRKNIDRIREKARADSKIRRKEDPAYRAVSSMRSRVWSLLKKKGAKKIRSLGLEKEKLKAVLEAKFVEGMSWDNYGSKWHVDHIIPCTAFNVSDPSEMAKCFHYDNLQPLWAADNIRKSNKLP